jgi:hypothetical protein
MTQKPSRRFDSSRLIARLVPVLLIILALALVVTLVIIGMSLAGVTPSF